jgi:SNF2 family DNA or RNA helicase
MSLLVLRRTKKQVLSDLPEKVRVPVDVAVDQEAYERAESEARAALRGDGSALGVLTKLRQAVGALKVDAALEWIEDFLAGGDPLIVFYHHHEVGERLAAGIKVLQKTLAIIDGGTTMDARRDAVQRFQAGQVAVLLVSIRAGGEGITLTRAHDVLLLERDWTAAAEEQAEDRAHRIGQTRDVTVWVMRAPGTLDEMIEAAVERKRGFAGAVLDNGSVMNEVADMLRLKEGA